MPVSHSNGCVCGVSLYSAWAAGPDRARVLLALLCRMDDGGCDAKFALVNVCARGVTALARGARDVTAARLEDLARAAAAPRALPLATLGHAATWKALYVSALAALRAQIGPFRFYRETRFGVDNDTGLLVSAEEPPDAADAAPRAAVLRSALRLAVEEDAVRAAAAAAPAGGGSLARARLCAMRDGHADLSAPGNVVEFELTTKTARFYRIFADIAQPPRKRAGRLADVFAHREYRVRTEGSAAPVVVRALVPVNFDCVVADARAFSPMAAMLVFAQWHAALFTDGPAQVLGFLGPQLNPGGEERDYCFLLGFPGVPLVVSAADAGAVRDDLDAHVLTDGLWPAFGVHVYHALGPWNFLDGAAVASLNRRITAARAALPPGGSDGSDWPAGRVSTILNSPACVRGLWLAKFDFSAFFPTLYAHLVPENARLARAICARRDGRPGLKPSLLTFFGGLRHVHAPAYEAVIALANAVAAAVERAANARNFAVCTYVKDGFWGAFGDAAPEVVPREAALAAALALRDDCQRAAEAVLRAAGLHPAEGAELHLRFEGLFTHAVSWSANKYWLWDATAGGAEGELFVGFPCRTEFGRMAKRSLAGLLRRAVAQPERPSDTVAAAAAACDALVHAAFERRGDVRFWSATAPIADWGAVPRSALSGGDLLDADHGPRPYVLVAGHEAAPFPLPWALYRSPVLLPDIACRAHMAPVLQELARMLNGALAALAAREGDDEPPIEEFEYNLADFDFLFA
ncbi:helicase-primase subunit [bovine alphaherpesvirus 1]|nr:helicase-primase subunit [Bovine alphaherpesvirus 1]